MQQLIYVLEMLLVLQSLPLLFLQGLNPRVGGTWQHNRIGLALNKFKFCFFALDTLKNCYSLIWGQPLTTLSWLVAAWICFFLHVKLFRCLKRIVLLTASNKQQADPDNSQFFHYDFKLEVWVIVSFNFNPFEVLDDKACDRLFCTDCRLAFYCFPTEWTWKCCWKRNQLQFFSLLYTLLVHSTTFFLSINNVFTTSVNVSTGSNVIENLNL